MTKMTSPKAKRLSRQVPRIPFGFPTLQGRFQGIPAGSSILLGGSPDAGTDAFAHTHAALLMTMKYHPGLMPKRVSLDERTREALPSGVQYVTLDRDRSHTLHEMDSVLSPKLFNILTENAEIRDFSDEFFDIAPVPDDLRTVAESDLESDLAAPPGSDDAFQQFLSKLGEHVAANGDGNLIVLDSLTALQRATEFGYDWGDVIGFMAGLQRASTAWGGITDVLYHARPSEIRSNETINTVLDGCIYFYTNDEGDRAQKTMRIGEFGGALSRRSQVVYETSVTKDGFRVMSSRNI